jgi:hypothetical protein
MRIASAWIGLLAVYAILWPIRPAAGDDAPNPPAQPSEDRRVWKIDIHPTGTIDPTAWQPLSDDQQKANLVDIQRKARDAFRQADVKMHLDVTPHFLIYHQLPMQQGMMDQPDQAFGQYLEQGYNNLVMLFGLRNGEGQGANVWRGRAVVYLMSNWSECDSLLRQLHPSQSQLRQPCLTLSGDGTVDLVIFHGDGGIGDYRNGVLAMTVGFLYRLHSPKPVPAWIETGLPAAVADSMQYQPRWQNGQPPPPPALAHAQMIAAEDLAIMNDLGALLDEDKPTYPDFSVYESLSAYMLQKNHLHFGALVMEMKDGKNWKDSLEPKFGMDFKKLDTLFRASLPSLH